MSRGPSLQVILKLWPAGATAGGDLYYSPTLPSQSALGTGTGSWGLRVDRFLLLFASGACFFAWSRLYFLPVTSLSGTGLWGQGFGSVSQGWR